MNDLTPDNHSIRRRRRLLALALAGLLAFGPLTASASQPVVSKLHQTGREDYQGSRFGESVAVSEKWILVGASEPGALDMYGTVVVNEGLGSVSVFDTRTRRLVRRLAADDGAVGDAFGRSVSVFGDLALIGAVDAAYVFDLRTGRQLRKLSAPEENVRFGTAVSLSGRLALVGSPHGSGLGPMTGAAWIYDLDSSGPPMKLAALDGSGAGAGDQFGESVSLCGNLALVGAYLDSHSGKSQAGSAYVFDARGGNQLRKLLAETPVDGGQFGERVGIDGNVGVISSEGPFTSTPPTAWVFDLSTGTRKHQLVPGDSVSFDGFASSIAVDGNLALIGAPGSVSAYLFDVNTGEELARIPLPDPKGNDFDFASSVALFGDFAVIGFPGDIDRGKRPFTESGAAYFYRPLARPLPLSTLTQTRNFAPGTVEADFLSLLDPVINPEGETAFVAALTGPGAGGGTARRGIWSDAAVGNPLGLAARGGTDIGGGLLVNATMKPIYNRPDDLVFQGSVRGTGVNGSNNTALFRSVNGGAPNAFLRKGFSHPNFSGAVLERFLEVSQSHVGNVADVAVAFRYRFGPGGVSPISDTGILAVDHDGSLRDFFNEDWFLDSVADTIWAQFTPRSTMVGNQMAWSAFLKGSAVSPADNMGLFQIQPGAPQESFVARKGTPVPGGGVMRTFLAEAINPDEIVTYRVALAGAGVENEKLQFGSENVWTKGDLVDYISQSGFPSGARLTRVLKFWPADDNRIFYLAKVTGRGVNASNDCALFLWDGNSAQPWDTIQVLIREGEFAPDCDGSKIRLIQRVDVDPHSGEYVILAGLTGHPSMNQALFTGSANVGDPITGRALRLPVMKLRKGTSYQAALGETTRLLSLSLTNTNDRFGAGAKGGPQVIDNQGRIVVSARFTNRAWELLSGKP